MSTKKATFNLPVDLILFLDSKENKTLYVAEAIRKAKEKEEIELLKAAAREMENSSELWDELSDWDNTLGD